MLFVLFADKNVVICCVSPFSCTYSLYYESVPFSKQGYEEAGIVNFQKIEGMIGCYPFLIVGNGPSTYRTKTLH